MISPQTTSILSIPPTINQRLQSQQSDMKKEQVEVMVRIKPSEYTSEIRQQGNIIAMPSTTYERRQKLYHFNQVFGTHTSNQQIWEQGISSHLQYVNGGHNLTLLTYGVTGSGKTHTVFGSQEEEGIAYLLFKKLMENNEGNEVQFSFLEIYNENIKDLLSTQQDSKILLLEDNNRTTISNLVEVAISSYQQLVSCIHFGLTQRSQSATLINLNSSRSHAILQIQIVNQKIKTKSKVTIIDLAGSERISSNEETKTILQGSNINRSLLALGNCLNILSDPTKKSSYIPYRDSKLTRLLKDSLSGSSKLIMIACISTNPSQIEETINTIQYASRASKIKYSIKKEKEEVCCSCGLKQKLQESLAEIKRLEERLETVMKQIKRIDLAEIQRQVVHLLERNQPRPLKPHPNTTQNVKEHLNILLHSYQTIQSSVLSSKKDLPSSLKSKDDTKWFESIPPPKWTQSAQSYKQNIHPLNHDLSILSKNTANQTFISEGSSQMATRRMKRDFDEGNKVRLRLKSPLTFR